MKIGNTSAPANIAPVGPSVNGGREANGTGKAGNAGGGGGDSSTVTLSSAANALFDGSVDGSFDAAKVDRIRQSISDGTYKINPGAIADKLIANAQELLGKVSNN